ncbi:homocysteine methyltransferase [Roseovarius albus]|uniref:Homocysteine methyltransferase n=1 Tax=Roseovarius albus TaxID=1247867 RepID=A0A1X7A3Y8_9RHOB|nr:homocysteine S-methyltransferase family protein [Roseovarius albus]SLN69992.1 homocysteine methyltransferase [Roseovarius albus]
MRHEKITLPQLSGEIFMSDGGIETTLIFEFGFELPDFAAFPLLNTVEGRDALKSYYRKHASIAQRHERGFIFESATWRASQDWGDRQGYSVEAMADANRAAIKLIEEVREEFPELKAVISGCVGPRGDGYDPGELTTPSEAEAYHAQQVRTFASTHAEMVSAITITNTPEAIGITRAANSEGLPVTISFTVETDGRLPTGQPLGEAIDEVDAKTRNGPAYYMLNCAHPDHFRDTLANGGDWLRRLSGIRANASRQSHAELDEATELDDGDPVETGRDYAELRQMLPHLVVFGGCCGTDHRHIEHAARALGAE